MFDILKILDQVPGWKAMKYLPGRVKLLEDELAALKEQMKAPAEKPGDACPYCGKYAMRMAGSVPMGGRIGQLGVMRESWKCGDCGKTLEKNTGHK
ncbi:hypothetical protein G3A39_42975 [Paraburkholderia aspalathi]|nr:hypothetical protein [Paraburkholderia aspalathi]